MGIRNVGIVLGGESSGLREAFLRRITKPYVIGRFYEDQQEGYAECSTASAIVSRLYLDSIVILGADPVHPARHVSVLDNFGSDH